MASPTSSEKPLAPRSAASARSLARCSSDSSTVVLMHQNVLQHSNAFKVWAAWQGAAWESRRSRRLDVRSPDLAKVRASRPFAGAPMSRLAPTIVLLLAAASARAGLPSVPVEQWRWDGDVDAPDRPSPAGSPLVVQLTDDDGNGTIDAADSPDVVFLHWGATPAITALDGATGDRIFEATHPTFTASPYLLVSMGSLLAAGDVD